MLVAHLLLPALRVAAHDRHLGEELLLGKRLWLEALHLVSGACGHGVVHAVHVEAPRHARVDDSLAWQDR